MPGNESIIGFGDLNERQQQVVAEMLQLGLQGGLIKRPESTKDLVYPNEAVATRVDRYLVPVSSDELSAYAEQPLQEVSLDHFRGQNLFRDEATYDTTVVTGRSQKPGMVRQEERRTDNSGVRLRHKLAVYTVVAAVSAGSSMYGIHWVKDNAIDYAKQAASSVVKGLL